MLRAGCVHLSRSILFCLLACFQPVDGGDDSEKKSWHLANVGLRRGSLFVEVWTAPKVGNKCGALWDSFEVVKTSKQFIRLVARMKLREVLRSF